MPNLALQVEGDFQGVTQLEPAGGVDSEMLLRVKCTSCQDEHPRPVVLLASNVEEMQKSRGEANLVISCPTCRKENSAKFVVKSAGNKGDAKFGEASPWSPISPEPDSAPAFHTLCTIDFRGMEPLNTSVDDLLTDSSAWKCMGSSSKTLFDDVSFDDGEWHDYDEKAGDEVSIVDGTLRWKKV